MRYYIFPNQRDLFVKKFNQATKHLDPKPKMTIGEAIYKTETTIMDFGEEGQHVDKRKVLVLPIDVEEITSGDWVLVSDVYYREGFKTMVNSRYYKDIPEQFGTEYTRCDYCGHSHPDRKQAHIVYNTRTGEWKQIGTSCGKKMFRGGDIAKFSVSLYNLIDMCGGCTEESFGGWCRRQPDHSFLIAHRVDVMIEAVRRYRRDVEHDWIKRDGYRGTYTFIVTEEGTGARVWKYYGENADSIKNGMDADYAKAVCEYVKGLENDDRKSYNPFNMEERVEEGFKSGIKRAFADGFILEQDLYRVWFAIKMYEDSLTFGDWEKAKAPFVQGEKFNFVNAKLTHSHEGYDEFYGTDYTYCEFEYNGVKFTKSFSNYVAFIDSFKVAPNTFTFACKIGYIDDRKRQIRLEGRCSKVKK